MDENGQPVLALQAGGLPPFMDPLENYGVQVMADRNVLFADEDDQFKGSSGD